MQILPQLYFFANKFWVSVSRQQKRIFPACLLRAGTNSCFTSCFSFLKRKWNYWKNCCLKGDYEDSESKPQWKSDFECEMQQQDTLFSQYSEIGKYLALSKIQQNVNLSVFIFYMLRENEVTVSKTQIFFWDCRLLFFSLKRLISIKFITLLSVNFWTEISARTRDHSFSLVRA